MPGVSEASAIDEQTLLLTSKAARAAFKPHRKFVHTGKLNIKKIKISELSSDGVAIAGEIHVSLRVSPIRMDFTKDAFLILRFDADHVYTPPLFEDNIGQVRGFTEVGVRKWMFGKANLRDHMDPYKVN